MVTEKDKDFEIDGLVKARLDQMIPIADGQGVEYHLRTNSSLTSKAVEFISNMASTYGAKTLGEINLDEISKNLVNAEDGAPKDGVAKNEKQLEQLFVDALKNLQAKFPNLNINQIKEFVIANAGTVSVQEGKINEASDKKAAEDLEAARQMIGMLFKPAMFAVGAGIVAHECSVTDDFAKENSSFNLFGLLSQNIEKGIS